MVTTRPHDHAFLGHAWRFQVSASEVLSVVALPPETVVAHVLHFAAVVNLLALGALSVLREADLGFIFGGLFGIEAFFGAVSVGQFGAAVVDFGAGPVEVDGVFDACHLASHHVVVLLSSLLDSSHNTLFVISVVYVHHHAGERLERLASGRVEFKRKIARAFFRLGLDLIIESSLKLLQRLDNGDLALSSLLSIDGSGMGASRAQQSILFIDILPVDFLAVGDAGVQTIDSIFIARL